MLQLRAQRSCATTPYFCIPDNPQLRALRDTIDDRLFKIRHCEDIEGVFRQLPLFELPIDPGLLVQAAAQGPTGKSVATTLKSRFHYVNSTPLALLQLRETGACEFALPEVLFDMDYPGHYMRRVKSVGLRIPCVPGTHTSLNCTLRLLEHKFRTSAIAKG